MAPSALEKEAQRPLAWANWSMAWALIAAVLLLRLVYLVWLSPWELVGDEAYYWEQARHLDLCYNEKGPALAWMIAPCWWIFGAQEWAVRLPVVIAFVISAWALGRLALSVSRGDQRVAFFSVMCFCLLPAFQANAQICTQDGPLIAVWIGLTAIGLRYFRKWHAASPTWFESLLLWFVLGIGFLFKQSIPLFLPSLVVYWLIQKQSLRWRWSLIAEHAAGAVLFLAIISPMIVWNAQHGWPMLAHTLGHLGAGGDQAGHANKGNIAIWLGAVIGGVLFAFGPACMFLFGWGSIRQTQARGNDVSRWRDNLWLMCATWPSLAFFVALAFIKPVVPSWPLPSLAPLCVIVGELAIVELPRYQELVRRWRAQRTMGDGAGPQQRKPDTLFHFAWAWIIIYGIGGWLLVSFPTVLRYIPHFGPRISFNRITGHRAKAQRLEKTLESLKPLDPLVVTRHYMAACLYAFYLPEHPVICTAGKYLGKRSTTFDQWVDTDLNNPSYLGRTLLLDGRDDEPWERALIFDQKRPIEGGTYYIATNYRGPRPDHPIFGGSEETDH